MMTPKEIIAAFLEVWENHPNLFLSSDVEPDLDILNQSLSSSPDTTSADIAKEIQEWCKKHPTIRDSVRLSTKKPKPKRSEDTSLKNILRNQYPEISKILRQKIEQLEQQ